MQDEQERRGSVVCVCVCVLISRGLCWEREGEVEQRGQGNGGGGVREPLEIVSWAIRAIFKGQGWSNTIVTPRVSTQ